jgi:hypothetical protein
MITKEIKGMYLSGRSSGKVKLKFTLEQAMKA